MRMNVSSIIVMRSNEIGYHLQVGGDQISAARRPQDCPPPRIFIPAKNEI